MDQPGGGFVGMMQFLKSGRLPSAAGIALQRRADVRAGSGRYPSVILTDFGDYIRGRFCVAPRVNLRRDATRMPQQNTGSL